MRTCPAASPASRQPTNSFADRPREAAASSRRSNGGRRSRADYRAGASARCSGRDSHSGRIRLRKTNGQMPLRPRVIKLAEANIRIRHRRGVWAATPSIRSSERSTCAGVAPSCKPCVSGLEAVVEARLILGKTGRHVQTAHRPALNTTTSRVSPTLPQVPLHRVAEEDRDMQARLSVLNRWRPSASSQVTRAMITATGCTSRPRTCSTQAVTCGTRSSGCFGRGKLPADRVKQKRARTAGRIEHALRQRLGQRASDDFSRQPVRACSIRRDRGAVPGRSGFRKAISGHRPRHREGGSGRSARQCVELVDRI